MPSNGKRDQESERNGNGVVHPVRSTESVSHKPGDQHDGDAREE